MRRSPETSWRGMTTALIMAGLVTVGGLTSVAGPALAHHSFATYDKNRTVKIKGTVKDWQFTNPHSWLQLLVDEGGQQTEYSIEGASVNTLVRRGWGAKTFKPGDKVDVVMYPLKNGNKGGAFLSATFPNGKTISSGITPN